MPPFARCLFTALVSLPLLSGLHVSTAQAADGSEADKPKQPLDIVVILVDQLSPRCTGYAGDPDARTPNLDTMARDGMSFDACYTPSPMCMPARCSLLSGLYPHNHHLWANNSDFYMPAEWSPMFRDIKGAGYTTAQIGKLHWTGGHKLEERYEDEQAYYRDLGLDYCQDLATPFTTPSQRGPYQEHLRSLGLLDAYCKDIAFRMEHGEYEPSPSAAPPTEHNDRYIADRGIDFIQAQAKDKPYCVVISLPGPHPPMDAPGQYSTMFDPDALHLPPNIPETFGYRQKSYDHARLRPIRANYYGKIALIDDCVGRIFQAVRDRGTFERTLFIFTADHGEMMGAHGCLSKGRHYEESARVPLLLMAPGHIEAGRRTDALVQMFDIYPTIVDVIGGQLSDGHFARSFWPVASGKSDRAREVVFSEIGWKDKQDYMVRRGSLKWFTVHGKAHLFDVAKDPWEQHDLIDNPAYRDEIAELNALHLGHLRQTQYNASRNYIPLLKRAGGWEKDTRGLSERLYEGFRKRQGLE